MVYGWHDDAKGGESNKVKEVTMAMMTTTVAVKAVEVTVEETLKDESGTVLETKAVVQERASLTSSRSLSKAQVAAMSQREGLFIEETQCNEDIKIYSEVQHESGAKAYIYHLLVHNYIILLSNGRI